MLYIKYSTLFRAFSLSVLITFIGHSGLVAQNQCTQNLKKAQKEYDEGRLTEVTGLLESCLKDGFTREQKLQAYRLLILTNLFSDEPEMAEKNLLLLLKEDPEYNVNPAGDPAEFVKLYQTYRTIAIFNLGFTGGLNFTKVHNIQYYGTYNLNNSTPTYTSSPAIQLGVTSDILIRKGFQLNVQLVYTGKTYTYKNTLLDYSVLTLKESQSYLELPLALRYNIGKRKLKLYLQAGVQGGMLLSSNATAVRKEVSTDQNQANGPSISMKSQRNKLIVSSVFGLGIKYKFGYGYMFADARYTIGFSNVANTKNRYSNTELIYKYGYIDNDFSINNLTFSLGYMKSFYKPKKVKKLS